jgi:class 3 adenylate cyclase
VTALTAPETRYVRVGDADVAYQVVGKGPVDLVYHHGVCHVDLQWDVGPEAAFLRRLASFSRLILFDRRGTGVSERAAGGFVPTWEEWGEDLARVLDAVGANKAAIFAEAEAGATAILFAATRPERVQALILGNTTARLAAADDYPIGLTVGEIDAIIDGLAAGWGTGDWLRPAFPSIGDDEEAIAALARLCRAAATPKLAATVFRHIYNDLDVRDFLQMVQAPTLVLHNQFAHDRPLQSRARQAEYLAERIPTASLVDLPGNDFLFFGGDIDRVAGVTAEFLTGERPPIASDRILTTVLFTDIVDSTAHAVALGDERWRELLNRHDRVVRSALRQFRGLEVNTTGDGFVARFDGPARALRCATELIAAMRPLGVEIRAGAHTGECEVRGEDLAGQAVHVAARVSAKARAGEVLVTRTVVDLVAGSGLEFADRGRTPLKGLPGDWNVFRLTSG